MPISVEQTSGSRTLLQCVQRALRGIGEDAPGTLSNPSSRVQMAMEAAQDARDLIFYEARWDFRNTFCVVPFVANQAWYALPADFAEFLTIPTKGVRTSFPLTFKRWDQVCEMFPDMRSAPPGMGGEDVTTAYQLSINTLLFGDPYIFTRFNDYLGFFTIPTAESIVASPNAVYTYMRHATPLESEADVLDLPRDLWLAHHHLTLARVKLVAEFADWQMDEQIGRERLRRVIVTSGTPVETDRRNTPLINYNE